MDSQPDISLSRIMKVLHKILTSKCACISRGSHFIKIKNRKVLEDFLAGSVKLSSLLKVLEHFGIETVLMKRKVVIVTSCESIYYMFDDILSEMENRQGKLLEKLEKINKVVEDAAMMNSTLRKILQIK